MSFSTQRTILLCVNYAPHRIDMFRGDRQAHGPLSKPQPGPFLTRSVIWCYRKLSCRPLITRLTGYRRGGRAGSLIERGQRRGVGVLPLDLLFYGAQGMIPHHVMHESRKQHPGHSPQNPTRTAVAFFVVECRVNGQPAVSVLGRCDIEDEFPVVRKPPVELV